MSTTRVEYQALASFASQCLQQAGASPEVARNMAENLLAGDLLGFRTHGLRRLPYNVKQLQQGHARGQGDPRVLTERAAVATWDAEGLSGLYVVPKAVDRACAMAREAGTGTIVIRRAEHAASLAAYLERATDQGLVISLMASTPAQSSVAPYGAKSRVFSPNPFAIGVPTSGQPLLMDISLSVTAAGKVRQAYDRQEQLPWPALVSAAGEISRDPATYLEEPAGAILPLGGADLGYKGYGLCLMSEIWTMALSNYGRLQGQQDGEYNSVMVQVMDPSAFGELEAFKTVTDDLLRRCREASPIDPGQPVRIPGERALALKQEQLTHGVQLDDLTWPRLQHLAEKLDVVLPEPATAQQGVS